MEWLLGFNISNLKYYKLTPCTLFFSVQNNNFERLSPPLFTPHSQSGAPARHTKNLLQHKIYRVARLHNESSPAVLTIAAIM